MFSEFDSGQVLQFSIASLKNGLNLQCRFDASTVRFASALIAPTTPILLLVCCIALEVYNRSGISAGLKAGRIFNASNCVDVGFEHAGSERVHPENEIGPSQNISTCIVKKADLPEV